MLLRASVDNVRRLDDSEVVRIDREEAAGDAAARSGRIFATVIALFTRAPRSTPRMLIVANTA